METVEKKLDNGNLCLQNSSFDIFENGGNYINFLRMYHGYFNQISNVKSIQGIDNVKLSNWLSSEMKDLISREHYNQYYSDEKKTNLYNDQFIFLQNNIVINIYRHNVFIIFEPRLEKEAQELQNQLLQFRVKKRRKTTQISLIVGGNNGLTTKVIDLKKPKLNLNLHYNDDFKEIHYTILKNIKKLRVIFVSWSLS